MRDIAASIASAAHRGLVMAGLSIVVSGLCTSGAAAQPRKIYIAPDDHTDYYWSATGDTYHGVFVDTLDQYLRNITDTAGDPSQYQSRWNADGTLWLWEYEHDPGKTPADFDALMARVRDQHINVPLNTLISTYGGAPFEAVIRDMYYAGQLERRYALRFPTALTMENATIPYGLGAILRGAGAKWTWHGICGCTSPSVPNPGVRQYDAYYWLGPDGSKLLTKWNSLQPLLPGAVDRNQGFGGYAEARYTAAAIDQTSTPGFTSVYPYSTIGIFGQGWDDVATKIPLDDPRSFPAIARAKTTADTQVIVSNEQDYFADFEKNFGPALPGLAVSFGNEWDLGAASLAEKSAIVKREVEKLRSAEALATLASLADPHFLDGRDAARDLAFHDLGEYFEHNWGAGPGASPEQRLAWQTQLVTEISAYVDALYADGVAALGSDIKAGGGTARFFVFNPLSFPRTDIADIAYPNAGDVQAVDVATGRIAATEVIGTGASTIVRVLATNVPAIGYKVFDIQPRTGPVPPPVATIVGQTVDTPEFTATVNGRGALSSLIYKANGNTELARIIGGRAINDIGGGTGPFVVERNGAVSATVRVDIRGKPKHTARYTFYKSLGRIDIRDDINENFSDLRTWAYGFDIAQPIVHHEEVGVIAPARLAPEGIYSPDSNDARYDWLTLNHFADMSRGDDAYGVTLSNADAYFMSLGNSTLSSLDITTPQINVLAGGLIAIGPTGQGGDTHFLQRFSLKPHGAYDEVGSLKFALSHQNPLVTGPVTGGATAAYAGDGASFLKIGNQSMILWSLKPSQEGVAGGIIARVWNLSPANGRVKLSLGGPFTLTAATQTSHVETDMASAPVTSGLLDATLKKRQIATFRLAVSGASR